MGNRLTPIVKNLLIINTVIFAIQMLLEINIPGMFGLRAFSSPFFEPWQILTYMFIHADFMHILGNMFALFIFGTWLEQVLGSQRFLAFYMVTGMGAGALNSTINYIELESTRQAIEIYEEKPSPQRFAQIFATHFPKYYTSSIREFRDDFSDTPNDSQYIKESKLALNVLYKDKANIPTVGASGAIFGILVAFALIFPNLELMLLFFPVPIKAKYLATFYILFELYAGLNYGGASNVAHFAHLAGALIGFLLIRYWGIKKYY